LMSWIWLYSNIQEFTKIDNHF